jgi:hypothetical protein
VAAFITGMMLSGCSAFESSRKMDMTPFSDNTGTLFVEASKVARPFHWNYLKPHVDFSEFKGTMNKAAIIFRGLKGIVYYSNQLVSLNNARMKEEVKNDHLARYLTEVMRAVSKRGMLDSLGLDQGTVDTVIADIRGSKTFLDGIAAASPLVNAIVVTMGDYLNDIQAEMPTMLASIEKKVDADFASRGANYTNLVQLRTSSMRTVTLLYRARLGDQASLDTVLQEDPSLREFIPSRDKATSKGIAAAENYITDRLARLDTFIHQMDPDVQLYVAKRRELEDWRLNVDERVKITRDALVVWGQSHRNLGAGIPVPPLIDVTGLAGGLLRKMAPIP